MCFSYIMKRGIEMLSLLKSYLAFVFIKASNMPKIIMGNIALKWLIMKTVASDSPVYLGWRVALSLLTATRSNVAALIIRHNGTLLVTITL